MSKIDESRSGVSICHSLIPYTASRNTLLLRRYFGGSVIIDESYLFESMKAIKGAIKTVREKIDVPVNKTSRARNKKSNQHHIHEYTCIGIDHRAKIEFRLFLLKNNADLCIPIINSDQKLLLQMPLKLKDRLYLFAKCLFKDKIFIAIKDGNCEEVVSFLNGILTKRIM